MGNSRNSRCLQLGINLNSRATTKEATGTRCAVKVGFSKSETRKKFEGEPPHKKVIFCTIKEVLLLHSIH